MPPPAIEKTQGINERKGRSSTKVGKVQSSSIESKRYFLCQVIWVTRCCTNVRLTHSTDISLEIPDYLGQYIHMGRGPWEVSVALDPAVFNVIVHVFCCLFLSNLQ